MGNNPLSNLSSDDVIEFLEANGFRLGNTHGDDAVYCIPGKYDNGIRVTLGCRSIYPAVINNIIRFSGIGKAEWRNWFIRKRNHG